MYVFESLCADCFATKKLASIRILKHKARVAEVGSLSTKAKMPTKTARRDKCVVFARNCTVANLIQYNYAIYTKRHCFWPNMCVDRVICVLARLLAQCAPSAGCSWSPCPSPSSATTLPTSTRVRGGRSRSKRRGARIEHHHHHHHHHQSCSGGEEEGRAHHPLWAKPKDGCHRIGSRWILSL